MPAGSGQVGSGQDVFENLTGRVRSGQEVLEISPAGSGRATLTRPVPRAVIRPIKSLAHDAACSSGCKNHTKPNRELVRDGRCCLPRYLRGGHYNFYLVFQELFVGCVDRPAFIPGSLHETPRVLPFQFPTLPGISSQPPPEREPCIDNLRRTGKT